MKRLLLVLCALAFPSLAAAQTPVAPCVTTSSSATGASISGCGPVTATNPFPVTGTVASTGFDSGPVTAVGTVNGSSHAAGTSVGGLISVPLARVAGGSGIVTNFGWTSPGGATVQYAVRIWSKNPASTTCTDNTAFVSNAADDKYLIAGGAPFSITPAAPSSTTGDSKTYAPVTGVTWDYKNSDTSPTQNLYVCVVTTVVDVADESTSPVVMMSGPQN